jgi:PKD repeat protein
MKLNNYSKLLQFSFLLIFSLLVTFVKAQNTDVEAPSVPQNLRIVSLDHNHVTIEWDASTDNAGGSGMKGYPIWTCQTVWGGSDKYSTINSYTINFDAGWWALPGNYFQIAAQSEDNAGNKSALSAGLRIDIPPAPDVTPPSVPQNLRIVSLDHYHVTVAWDASTDNAGGSGLMGYPVWTCQTVWGGSDKYSNTNSYTINFDAGWWALPGNYFQIAAQSEDNVGNKSALSAGLRIDIPPAPDVTPPSVPQNLRIVELDHYHVKVAWDASNDNAGGSGLKGYPIGTGQTMIAFTDKYSSTNSYTITFDAAWWAIPNQWFIFAAKADDNAGNISAFSNTIRVDIPPLSTPDNSPPTTPLGLNGVATTQGVNLTWNQSFDNVGVVSYELSAYSGGILPSPLPPPTIYVSTTTSYTVTPAITGSMKYKVRAKDAAGNYSPYSTEIIVNPLPVPDVTPPSVPQNLRIVELDHFHVKIVWDASTDNTGGSGIKGYPIWTWQTVIGGSDKYSSTNSYTITFNNTHWSLPGQYFLFAAQGEDNAGNKSALSNSVRVDIPPAGAADTQAPTSPTNLVVANHTVTTLSLRWNPSTDNVGVVRYVAYVLKTNDFSPLPPPTQFTSTTASISFPAYPYEIEVYVKAFDAAGNMSSTSNTIIVPPFVASTDIIPPSIPTGLTGNATSQAVNLNWNASTDNVGVVLYEISAFPAGLLPSPLPPPTIYVSTTNSLTINPGITGPMTYKVRAKDASGNYSAYSITITVTPGSTDAIAPTAPTSLAVASHTAATLSLRWNPSTDNVGVTRYVVYVAKTNDFGPLPPPTEFQSTVPNISLAAYAYEVKIYVKAFDAAGNASNTSNTIIVPPFGTVTGDIIPPTVPTGLVGVATATSVNLTWNASTDNVGVVIYEISVLPAFLPGVIPPPVIYGVASNFLIAPAITEPTTYKVRARDAAGNYSAYSTIITVTPPVVGQVNFTATPTTAPAGTPIQFNFVPVNGVAYTGWLWYFGDGTTSTLANPTHSYASQGNYTVKLVAFKNVGGDSIVKNNFVTITAPLQSNFTATPTTAPVGTPIQFNFVPVNGVAYTGWLWYFGDGTTSTLANPTHSYVSQGSYTITMVAFRNSGGDSIVKNNFVTITAPLSTVDFTFTPANAPAGTPVQFTSTVTGSTPVASYLWQFGTNLTSTIQNPSFVYSSPGAYIVKLIVTYTNGVTQNIQKQLVINAANSPIKIISLNFPKRVREGQAFLVSPTINTQNNVTVSYEWAFGDGTTSTMINPAIIYNAPGDYNCKLIVTGAGNTKDTMAFIVKAYKRIAISDFNAKKTCYDRKDAFLLYNITPLLSVDFPNQRLMMKFFDQNNANILSKEIFFDGASGFTISDNSLQLQVGKTYTLQVSRIFTDTTINDFSQTTIAKDGLLDLNYAKTVFQPSFFSDSGKITLQSLSQERLSFLVSPQQGSNFIPPVYLSTNQSANINLDNGSYYLNVSTFFLGGSNAPCYLVDNFTIIKPAIGAITSLGAFNIEPTKATVKYKLEKLKPNTTYQVQVTLNNGFVNLYSFISSSIGEHTAIIELGNNPYQLTGNTPYIANAKLILPSNLNEPAVSANPISFTTVSPILITVNNGITLAVTMPFGTDNPSQVAITNQQGDIVASLTYTGNPNLVFMTGNLTMGIYFISHTINGHTFTQQFAIVR